jgi:glycosyltransferase involved in cell wall biosynthesis
MEPGMSAVSIIIPARDAADTLPAALDSVTGQRFGDWQAIVIDDGSTDATLEIADRYAARDPRVRIISTAGIGVAGARNAGIAGASGRRLLFLDADDWLAPDQLGRLFDAAEAAPDAVASYCGSVRVTPGGHAFLPRFSPEIADAGQLFARRNGLAMHAALVSHDHVEAIGGFDGDLQTCEDWDLWQRLAIERGVFVPVPGLHAPYCLRPASLSQQVDQLHADGLTVISRGFAALRDKGALAEIAQTAAEHASAHFTLWCATIAAGRGTPLGVPFRTSIANGEAGPLASMILEALCVGACCSPAALAARADWLEDKVEGVLANLDDPGLRRAVRNSLHKSLGVDAADTPLVSVVIPAYNGGATIDETLRSVRAQTHGRLEIVVVDDGSRDGTVEAVLAHAAVDPRVSVIRQANAGVAVARNTGWRSAAADLIAFVDADDLWAPTKIARQREALDASGERAGLAYTWYARIDPDSRVISVGHRPNARGQVLPDIFRGNFIGNGSAVLVRRSVLEEVGGFDPGLRARGAQGCEDFSIYFRIAEKHDFALVPEPLTGYRTLPGNMSSDMLQMLRSWRIVADEMLERHPQSRAAITEGLANYLEWCASTAAERGDFRLAWGFLLRLIGTSPWQAVRLVAGALPRRLARGARLRLGHSPRSKSHHPRFAIGDPDGAMAAS